MNVEFFLDRDDFFGADQNFGSDFAFESDPDALQSIIENRGIQQRQVGAGAAKTISQKNVHLSYLIVDISYLIVDLSCLIVDFLSHWKRALFFRWAS